MPKIIKVAGKPLFWIAIIICVSSFFRIFFLDLIEFKFDEAFTVFEITRFYHNPYLMQTGPIQSTGVYNFPLYNYIIIIFSFFSRNPQFLSFGIALINTITIVFFYFFIKKYYGNFIAVLASLFLSLSPWSILFSRKIWIPDIIIPFSIATLYFLQKWQETKNKKDLIFLGVFLSLLIQLHASGIFFTLVTIVILLTYKIYQSPRPFLIGMSLGFLVGIPYFVRQLTSSPFCIDCIAFFNYQKADRVFDLQNFFQPFHWLTSSGFALVLGKDYDTFLTHLPNEEIIFSSILTGYFLVLLGLVFTLKNKKTAFLAAYLILIPLFYFLTRTPSHMHYFVIISPVIALTTSLGVRSIWTYFSPRILKMILMSTLLILFVGNIIFEFTFYRFLSSQKNIQGDYGPIYSSTKTYMKDKLRPYLILPYYEELESYAYMFPHPQFLHSALGDFFIQKNDVSAAQEELSKALEINSSDLNTRIKVAYLYIVSSQYDKARKEILVIEKENKEAAQRLTDLLKQHQNHYLNVK